MDGKRLILHLNVFWLETEVEQALLGPRRLGVDFELQGYDLFLQVSDDSVVICCLGHEMRFAEL